MAHRIDVEGAYCENTRMTKALKARVFITLRPDILDVQGQTIQASLQSLGFQNIKQVRVGKLIEIESDQEMTPQMLECIDAMAKEILANPIIEDFRVEAL
jgi:phosphoribosylformylglycinamidine synthase